MRRILPFLLTGLLLCAACLAAPPGTEAPQAVHFVRAQTLTVNGTGFSPPPYRLDAASLPGQWREVPLPHVMPRDGVPAGSDTDPAHALTVVNWYRVQVPDLPRAGPRYLYIPRWKSDGQVAVYGDERLLYQSHSNLQWNGSNHPLWVPLEGNAGAAMPKTILVRVERLRDLGGAISTFWVGDEAAIGWRYRTRELLQAQLPLMTSAAFLAVGIFSLFVWVQRRRAALYGLFFIMSVVSFIRTMHDYMGLEKLPISDQWFGWLTVNSAYWLITTVHFFLVRLHHRPQAWLGRGLLGISAAVSLATLPGVGLDATITAPLVYALVLLMGFTAFYNGVANSWRAGSREGLLLAGWSALGMTFGVHDWLLQNNWVSVEGGFLGSYANIGAFFIFMYVMFRRYVGAIAEVEATNASLEQRLAAREAELTESHQQLREVEQRATLAQERQRLMQDMHDGLGSSLLSALRVVERGQIDETGVAEVLKGCIDDLRLAIDSMEPLEADLLVLLATLRFRLASRLESSGITLHWEVQDVPPLPWLDPGNALHILRILQEAFTNIIKHTSATEIHLATGVADLGPASPGVVVTISDNGSGFAVAAALQGRGRGLANQRRRAQAIGADIGWDSGPAGTRVTLWLPVSQQQRLDLQGVALSP